MGKLLSYTAPITTDAGGFLDLTGIQSLDGFTKLYLAIILVSPPPAGLPLTVTLQMGKISGSTLSENITGFPVSNTVNIRTFPVIGPEFILFLNGNRNTTYKIEAWVYLQ